MNPGEVVPQAIADQKLHVKFKRRAGQRVFSRLATSRENFMVDVEEEERAEANVSSLAELNKQRR